MPSPFPGMNPYLENLGLWPEVHHWLISAIGQTLAPQLRPKYRVAVEKRIYRSSSEEDSLLVGIPDVTVQRPQTTVESTMGNVTVVAPSTQPVTVTIPMTEAVKQSYLEIREVPTGEVVTAIELLSPVNKRSGEGREAYLNKRQRVLRSLTHLVEIDLLRGWEPMPILNNNIQSNYRILVSRSDRRPRADLYAFNLRDTIPSFPLPLKAGDVEPLVDLQTLLDGVYDLIGYDLVIDYSQNPVPALSEADAIWADALLRDRGLR